MKVRMKENLVDLYKEALPCEIDNEVESFLLKITGKVVDLIFTCGDAFEKEDNDIWLPDSLWTTLEKENSRCLDCSPCSYCKMCKWRTA